MSEILRYAGFKEEETFNEHETSPEADTHVDIASGDLDIASSKVEAIPGGIGKGPRAKLPTFNYPEGAIEYAADLNSVGFFWKMTLGGYEFEDLITEEEAEFNKHFFYGDKSSKPLSFITELGKDLFEHYFTGCVVDSYEISVSDTAVMGNVNIVAAQGKRKPIKKEEDLNIPNLYPLAFHEVNVELVTSDGVKKISDKVKELTLTIGNNPSTDEGKTVGSLHPTRIVTGDREVTVSWDLYFDNVDELERYENDEEFEVRIIFKQFDGGEMVVTLPKAYYDDVPTTVSGRDAISQSATVHTLVSPIIINEGEEDEEVVNTNIYVELENKEEGY